MGANPWDRPVIMPPHPGTLLKIKDNYVKKVITPDTFTGKTWQGIEHVQLRDFLLK